MQSALEQDTLFDLSPEAMAQDAFLAELASVDLAQTLTMAAQQLPLSWIQTQKLLLLAAEVAASGTDELAAPPF